MLEDKKRAKLRVVGPARTQIPIRAQSTTSLPNNQPPNSLSSLSLLPGLQETGSTSMGVAKENDEILAAEVEEEKAPILSSQPSNKRKRVDNGSDDEPNASPAKAASSDDENSNREDENPSSLSNQSSAKRNRIDSGDDSDTSSSSATADTSTDGDASSTNVPSEDGLDDNNSSDDGKSDREEKIARKSSKPTFGQLITAIERGNVEGVKKCLVGGVDVNARDECGSSPLDQLSETPERFSAEIMTLLLEAGANLLAMNGEGAYPFETWVDSPYSPEILEVFRRALINIKEKKPSPFAIKFQFDEEEYPFIFYIIAILANSDVHNYEEKYMAVFLDVFGKEKCLEQRYFGKSPFLYAIEQKKFKIAFFFLEQGVDPNAKDKNGISALQYFIRAGDADQLEKFLKNDRIVPGDRDDFGNTFLHEAALHKDEDICKVVVEWIYRKKINGINVKNHRGNTPLVALLEKLLKVLKKQHTNLDPDYLSDSDSNSDFSSDDDNINQWIDQWIESMQILLSMGASVLIENDREENAVTLAKEIQNYKELVWCHVDNQLNIELIERDFEEVCAYIENDASPSDIQYFNFGRIQKIIQIKHIEVGDFYQLTEEDFDGSDPKEGMAKLQAELISICEHIEKQPFVSHHYIVLHQIIKNLLNYDFSRNWDRCIKERFALLPAIRTIDNSLYWYTYIDEDTEYAFYRLTKIKENTDEIIYLDEKFSRSSTVPKPPQEEIIIQLMTTLVYEARHHGWNSKKGCIKPTILVENEACKLHHLILQKIDKKYASYGMEQYEIELRALEEREDYFGENLSENSDSEAERTYQAFPHRRKSLLSSYSKMLFDRSQAEKLFYVRPLQDQAEATGKSAAQATVEAGIEKREKKQVIKKRKNKKAAKTTVESTTQATSETGTEEKKNSRVNIRPFIKSDPKYDRPERQKIHREIPTSEQGRKAFEQAQRDLEKLNRLIAIGQLSEKTFATISTKFLIAQFRGVTYRIDQWNKSGRKAHRLARETNKPMFSRAVLEAGGYETFAEYFSKQEDISARADNKEEKLVKIAQRMQDQLLQLQASGPIKVKMDGETKKTAKKASNKSTVECTYDNALHALQEIYSNSYDKFHGLLKAFVDKFVADSEACNIETLKEAILLSIDNQFCPFVSTADTPEHALRYAYGDKFYKGAEEKRVKDDEKLEEMKKPGLFPHWRQRSGRVERPYSGKVFISLHDPLELVRHSHHVVSLDKQGQISIGVFVLPERETSFFGYIPADKVVSQHVVKYPSFHGPYKSIYLEKYGLTEDLYLKFQKQIVLSKPHSPQRQLIFERLKDHLVSFQEICLIEEANIAASQQGKVLVYRNEFGGFSLFPCKVQEPIRSTKKAQKAAALAATEEKREAREWRKTAAAVAQGFLNELFENYQIVVNPVKTGVSPGQLLLRVLAAAIESEPTQEELQKLYNAIKEGPIIKICNRAKPEDIERSLSRYYSFLTTVVAEYEVNICLHSPEILEEYRNINAQGTDNTVHLYYVGGLKFALLKPKESTNITNSGLRPVRPVSTSAPGPSKSSSNTTSDSKRRAASKSNVPPAKKTPVTAANQSRFATASAPFLASSSTASSSRGVVTVGKSSMHHEKKASSTAKQNASGSVNASAAVSRGMFSGIASIASLNDAPDSKRAPTAGR